MKTLYRSTEALFAHQNTPRIEILSDHGECPRLGTLERLDGNLDAAHRCAEEALEVARQVDSGWMQAGAECLLGRLALATGEATEAERYVHDALGRLVAKGFCARHP